MQVYNFNTFYGILKDKCEKLYTKKDIFGIHFLIVHISLNFTLRNIKSLVAADDFHIKGTVSQNVDLCLSFCFMFNVKKWPTF